MASLKAWGVNVQIDKKNTRNTQRLTLLYLNAQRQLTLMKWFTGLARGRALVLVFLHPNWPIPIAPHKQHNNIFQTIRCFLRIVSHYILLFCPKATCVAVKWVSSTVTTSNYTPIRSDLRRLLILLLRRHPNSHFARLAVAGAVPLLLVPVVVAQCPQHFSTGLPLIKRPSGSKTQPF